MDCAAKSSQSNIYKTLSGQMGEASRLENDFTKIEIMISLEDVDPSKEPGPDGFNVNYLNSCDSFCTKISQPCFTIFKKMR